MAQPDMPAIAVSLCENAWSLLDAERLFGVCGFVILRPGHAVCWAMFDDHVRAVPVHGLTGVIRKRIWVEMHQAGLRRLESTVDVHDRQALRWARIVGFEIEGLMRKSGIDAQDQWLIARIME